MKNDREIRKVGGSISGYIFQVEAFSANIIHGNGRENPNDKYDRIEIEREREIDRILLYKPLFTTRGLHLSSIVVSRKN